ncbi:hypothetical protein QM467_04925 [Rhodoblastus sp. 17X3]|uniref:hypothetical protein n=1 Tax=Rhodoblastus sp. 17X3 TaxID=3047026 RepID=UPI0024B6D410|nr:hypothetical protein [Rhodoblastus sp. 17X3]MDI9847404.1 hypothetical protein [Rhodoblastus sp. 17X3]
MRYSERQSTQSDLIKINRKLQDDFPNSSRGNESNDAARRKEGARKPQVFLGWRPQAVELLLGAAFLQKFPAHLELAGEGGRGISSMS